MKVIKKSVVKVNELKDYFIKELSVEPSDADVIMHKEINGNEFRVYADVDGDSVDIIINVWNEKTGVDLGTRKYSIPLFNDSEKDRIKFPNELVGMAVLKTLTNHEVGFEELGGGYISEWIQNDDDTIMSKIWFSDDFTYMSISHKILEPEETTISKEALLDQLGL